MPLSDTRCLTSSSLNPTSTVYYNNYNSFSNNKYLIIYNIIYYFTNISRKPFKENINFSSSINYFFIFNILLRFLKYKSEI
jgi:hypothetical protein